MPNRCCKKCMKKITTGDNVIIRSHRYYQEYGKYKGDLIKSYQLCESCYKKFRRYMDDYFM